RVDVGRGVGDPGSPAGRAGEVRGLLGVVVEVHEQQARHQALQLQAPAQAVLDRGLYRLGRELRVQAGARQLVGRDLDEDRDAHLAGRLLEAHHDALDAPDLDAFELDWRVRVQPVPVAL